MGTSFFSIQSDTSHYHGDRIRVLFLVSGIVMLVGLPVFQQKIPFPVSLSVIAVVLLAFLAGLTNPKQVWFSFLDTAASLIGFLVFEYYAITNSSNLLDNFFLINQLLALFFFVAFYFSVKTLRGFYLKRTKKVDLPDS
jgi:uncharacterized membrane protein YhhN